MSFMTMPYFFTNKNEESETKIVHLTFENKAFRKLVHLLSFNNELRENYVKSHKHIWRIFHECLY